MPSPLLHVQKGDDLLAVQEICQKLQEASIERLRSKIRIYPCHTNRSSTIGHPCEAYGFYHRTAWQKRELHDWRLQAIFDEGSLHEPAILKEVLEDCNRYGWSLVGQQQDFHDKNLQITGHVDALILIPGISDIGKVYPLEVKTMSPHIWDTITSDLDFKENRRPYLQAYYGQIQSYLYLASSPAGLWCLKNKVTGLRKYIPTVLDYDFCDSMIKRVERINAAVASDSVPSKIMNDQYCDDCTFRKICLGEEKRDLPKVNNERLLDAILAKEEFKISHDRYEKACDVIKEEAARSGSNEFICGQFKVSRKLQPEKHMSVIRKSYYVTSVRLLEK